MALNTVTQVFAPGTVLAFHNATAPLGWTKNVSYDDHAIRVSSIAGNGSGPFIGGNGFSTAFNSSVTTSGGVVSGTALSISQLPSHNHGGGTGVAGSHGHNMYLGEDAPSNAATAIWRNGASCRGYYTNTNAADGLNPYTQAAGDHNHTVSAEGSGSTHDHGFTNPSFNLSVKYVDVILCSKD